MSVASLAKKVKAASLKLLKVSEDQRAQALRSLALELRKNSAALIKTNAKDLARAKKEKLSSAIIDRLTLNEKRIEGMAKSCEEIASFAQVIGTTESSKERSDGLIIKKVRIPLGVIAMIFESRPNVVIEALALAIKSGNALILKGGKEASHSNKALFKLAISAIKNILPTDAFAILEKRSQVGELLKLKNEIDLVVPRGGSSLVNFVKAHATMPVIAHDKGLCHIFVDESASVESVLPIVMNAKTQRPGVCNAMETLLVHKNFSQNKLQEIIQCLLNAGVEIRADTKARKLNSKMKKASPKDFATEYLDLKMSLKIVDDVKEAVQHIQQYGSHHTEAILCENPNTISYFQNHLDASCIVVNASTRFNDGGELGLGAELGISTNKLHAYGPMGAKELTTTRFVLEGSGQIRK